MEDLQVGWGRGLMQSPGGANSFTQVGGNSDMVTACIRMLSEGRASKVTVASASTSERKLSL